MRSVMVFSAVLLLCGFAAAQATTIGGYASNWVPSYGVYAAPFVPLVVTPSVSLATVSPDPVGASNATWGNVAGATNATLSIVNEPPVGVYTQPVWYGPSAVSPAPAGPGHVRHEMEMHSGHHAEHRSFDYIAGYQMNGIAAMAKMGAGKKANRTITNDDINRMNQSTGTVKYDGKTEQMH
ncbi:MAG TPA: hypothetical protein VFA68_10390 [Terriglobales bacterium]|nr:hypothetical protein [Terriglobales bacterium]